MKTLSLLLLSISCFAQVGIGTTNPQATFHIAQDTSMVERMMIEGLLEKPNATRYMVVDGDPNAVGWNNGANLVVRPNINNVLELPNIGVGVPSLTIAGFVLDSIPLITMTVNLQANSTTHFTITYKVPVSVKSGNSHIGTDMGAKFYRDGISLDWIDDTQTIPSSYSSDHLGQTTLNGTYYDVIINSTASPITVIFKLEGWVKQGFSAGTNTVYSFGSKMHMTYQSINYSN